ncbi:MAG: zinc-finger domain-containing protein [Rhodospirillales bacterium]|nr:zinc-finger domain-containing protein [Rhodospirillales bacterium]
MDALETINVSDTTVGCDGGGGALGYPMVYLEIGPEGTKTCPYCSRHYVLEEGASQASGH